MATDNPFAPDPNMSFDIAPSSQSNVKILDSTPPSSNNSDWEAQNNNLGGLRVPGSTVGPSQGGFQSFTTPEAGIQAISKQLDRYASGATTGQPLNTLSQIVSTWAPPNENDTNALVKRAATNMGVDPNAPLDLSDPDIKARLIDATIRNERGNTNPIPVDSIKQILAGGEQEEVVPKATPPLGPYPTTYAAFKAAPKNLNNYELTGTQATGFTWAPTQAPSGQPFILSGPDGKGPTQDQSDQMRRALEVYSRTKYGSAFDRIDHAIYNLGPSFNLLLASLVGMPTDLVSTAINLAGRTMGYRPIENFPGTTPQIQRLMGKIGLDAYPTEENAITYGEAKTAQAAGAAIAPELGLTGLGSRGLGNLGARVIKSAEVGGSFGLGGSEGGDIYSVMQGKNATPEGQANAELAGGVALGPRVPLLMTGLPLLARAGKGIYGAGQRLIRGQPTLPDYGGMTHEQSVQAVGTALNTYLNEALDESNLNMAALGRVGSGRLTSSELAEMSQQAAQRGYDAKSAIQEAMGNIATKERGLWDAVDGQTPRNFAATRQSYQQMQADFEAQRLRNPAEFPYGLRDLLLGPDGLGEMDTLEAGKNTRSQVLQLGREEEAKEAPNRALIGYLNKIQGSLLNDLAPTSEEGTQEFKDALTFSRAANQLRNTKEVRQVLDSNKAGTDRLSDALTLENFLKRGPAGADAMNTLTELAQARYGGDGPAALLALSKDAIRQKFIEQVAPNGYVSMADYQRFISPAKYGSLLAHPEMADVSKQFEQAATSEQGVSRLLGFGEGNRPQFSYDRRNARMDLYTDGGSPEVALRHCLTGGFARNPFAATKGLLEQLGRDPTGDATMGLKQMLAQRFLEDTQGGVRGGIDWIKRNAGALAAVDQVDPGFSMRMQEAATPTTKAGVASYITNLAARWAGAQLGQKVASGGMGSSMVMASAGSRAVQDMLKGLTESQQLRLSSATIADQAYHDQFVKNFAGKPGALDLRALANGIVGFASPTAHLQPQQPQSELPQGSPPSAIPSTVSWPKPEAFPQ